MKTGELKVGGKGVEAVKVPIQEPENLDDLSQLAKGDASVIVRWATRGHRIESQERSGARDLLKELREKNTDTAEVQRQVAEAVASFDPTAKAARGGPREKKPITIVPGAGGKLTMDDFRRQLEAAGVKLNFADVAGG